MATSFNSLPRSASLSSIYSQAGRIFEEQKRNDRWTDYTKPKAFNDAMWYMAEKACCQGFSALQYMSPRDVASGMGNYISAHIATGISTLSISISSPYPEAVMDTSKAVCGAAGTAIGTAVGSALTTKHVAIGATVGTAVAPGPGTVIGGLIGLCVGTFTGSLLGHAIVDNW